MYERLVGVKVKIVFLDGDKITIVEGTVLEYDADMKMMRLFSEKWRTEVYINISTIQKLETRGLID